MSLFHDEEDRAAEPVPGLPEVLPAGERILWQGRSDGVTLAIHAFRLRMLSIWVLVIALARTASLAINGASTGELVQTAAVSIGLGILGLAIFAGLGVLMARSTLYTITDQRVVIRFGVAIRKYINIPYKGIASVGLKTHTQSTAEGEGIGSIALTTAPGHSVSYFHLWPHARPLRLAKAQPMLRALPGAGAVAKLLCAAIKNTAPDKVTVHDTQSRAQGPVPAGLPAKSPAVA